MPLRIVARNTATPELVTDEPDLIAAAKAGDHEAFHRLYETYRDKIFNLICYSLREPQQAEDVLQVIFLKVFQSLPAFRGESSFLTWIYRITMNECKNANSRRKFWLPLSAIFHQPQEQDSQPSPEMIHIADDKIRSVQAAVLKLKPKLREVVLLKYQEDLSYDEVALILGISSGTIASRLHRALKILEAELRKKIN